MIKLFNYLKRVLGILDFRPSKGFVDAVAELKRGDIAIDCGANVGAYTRFMAKTGATVFAFEPDPVAFAELKRQCGAYSNVNLIQAAASTRNGTLRLYLHRERERDPTKMSQSSSIIPQKNNVSEHSFVEVEQVDLAEFIERQGQIAILKMDIEGAEVDVLNHLIDRGTHTSVGRAFVETHERKNEFLKEPTARLRERLAPFSNFDLNWH